MTSSHPGKPVLAVLGKRNLELGPFAIDEAPQEAEPVDALADADR